MSAFRYRSDIDGLRAIAILAVLTFHFKVLDNALAGFMGVDIFFVISGYLITSIILHQLDTGYFSLQEFYTRRIRRLVPPLFVTLLVTVVAGYFILLPEEFAKLAIQGITSQLYVANIYYWRSVSYFGLHAENVLLLHTWSLAVEEQFYLIYPLLLTLAYRYCKKHIWLILSIVLAVSFLLNLAMVDAKPEATFYLLPTRAWELLIGSCTYLISRHLRIVGIPATILGVAGVGLLTLTVLLFDQGTSFPGYFAVLPSLGSACLILAGSHTPIGVSRILCLPPLVYVGKISYSLYLFHWPITIFGAYLLKEDYSLAWRLFLFFTSFAIASLSYHFVESPFRLRQLLKTDQKLILGYSAGLLASILVFGSIVVAGGFPNRFPPEVVRLSNYANDKPMISSTCEFNPKLSTGHSTSCAIGAVSDTPEWLIFGDSHAWAAYPAIDLWLKKRDENARFSFFHGCPPIEGIDMLSDHGSCRRFNASLKVLLKENPSIRRVFLISTWRQVNEAIISESDHKVLTKAQAIRLFDRQFSATLSNLNASGVKVTIWEPLAGAKQSVPSALARSISSGIRPDIEHQRSEYLSEFEFFFSALEKHKTLIDSRFSTLPILCNSGKCLVEINGRPLYFDNGHLSASFAGFWADELEKQIPR